MFTSLDPVGRAERPCVCQQGLWVQGELKFPGSGKTLTWVLKGSCPQRAGTLRPRREVLWAEGQPGL